ncbi:MAG: OprO/OprP family phosphate-selective porin [Bacteroidota bacterium]|nr:OprO/OprP family phosphate-selective porin [Bacteroidota bacterium]
MNKFLLLLAPLLVGAGATFAQTTPSPGGNNPTAKPVADSVASLKKKLNVNVLLRSSLEVPGGNQGQASFRLNEARFEVRGDLMPQLSYRVRYRLNQLSAPRSLDNSPGSLDIAYAIYRFGPNLKWNLTAGKQAAMVGSWEFEKNPTFEYQYSDYVNRQLNLFSLGAKVGYDISPNHAVLVQLHNTYNDSFQNAFQTTGYAGNNLSAARTPMGVYVSWLGKFFDQHFLTFYSYNVSRFAQDQTNQSLSLGNKVAFDKFSAYLDLATSNVAVEYFNLASPGLNRYQATLSPAYLPTYGQNLNYKNAVLRLDYQFVPGWFVTAKGFYETASQRDDGPAGRNFRRNIGYLGGLEYQPIRGQDLKFFGYYYQHHINYYNAVAATNPNQENQLFAVGMLYFIQALK